MCKQASVAEPKTIGEHIRRCRLQLHLFQADLARLLGVDIASVRNWEQGVFEPAKTVESLLIGWLGYNPRKAVTGRTLSRGF